jgi:hypothetical protein
MGSQHLQRKSQRSATYHSLDQIDRPHAARAKEPDQEIWAYFPGPDRRDAKCFLCALQFRSGKDGHRTSAKFRIGTSFGQHVFPVRFRCRLGQMKQRLQEIPVLGVDGHGFTLEVRAKQGRSVSVRSGCTQPVG